MTPTNSSGNNRTNWRLIVWIALVAVTARFLAFGIFSIFDIYNDSGLAVKPLLSPPAYFDYVLYRANAQSAFSELDRPVKLIGVLIDNPKLASTWLERQSIKPGPIFPLLLGLFDYEQHPQPLSWTYLALGTVLGVLWAKFLADRGMGWVWQSIVACFPALVYYSFLVSTDLLYAVAVALLYASCSATLAGHGRALFVSMFAMLLATLIRPNALALIPTIFFIVWSSALKTITKMVLIAIWVTLGLYMLVYYLPYYWVHTTNAGNTHYWGLLPEQFYNGLFPGLPTYVDRSFSICLLFFSKLLHAVGLRPSYAGLADGLTLLRGLPGILFLPGIFYGLLRGTAFDRLFLSLFLVPVFVGASQERYLLAISPMLIHLGIQAYRKLFQNLTLR